MRDLFSPPRDIKIELLLVVCAVLVQSARAEQFGIIKDNDQPRVKPNVGTTPAFSHSYDGRGWLGQPTSEVCRNMDLARDLLLVSTGSCLTTRFANTIQRPILFIPPDVTTEGCLGSDAFLNNSSKPHSNSTTLTNADVIPFHLHGYQPAELITGLVQQAFQLENVLLIHICDYKSYCGREGLQQTVSDLHDRLITSMQCWITAKNDTDFRRQFTTCMESTNFLSILDRRLMIVLHTNSTVIPSSVEILNTYGMLSLGTKVLYIVPPNYRVSDLDFVNIKDQDDVGVVRWQGERWLASITKQRAVDRFSQFWSGSSAVPLNDIIPDLANILTTVSANQYYSRMITANDSSQVLPREMCSTAPGGVDQLKLIAADLSKIFSCVEKTGLDVCSSYTVIKYDIDPRDDTPRPQTFASWSTSTGYHRFELQAGDNLRGRKLRIAVMQSPPFLQRNETAYAEFTGGNETLGLYQGVIPSMLRTLSSVLNFRYELVFTKKGDQFYGAKDERTGKWNGLVGMLQRKEVDMIAADLTVSAARKELLDYTVPFYEDSITVLLPRSQFDKSPFTFLFPFSTTVWFCVIAAVALSGPLLFLFSRLSPYYQSEDKPNHFASLSESYMYCYGSIVSQGGQVTPDADSSRIFMVFWWLFGICTVATYSGNLIAFLTFPGKLKFVDNFEEFVYTSKIQPVVQRNSYVESLFLDSQKPSYMETLRRIQQNEDIGMADYYETAVERVSRYKYGYIGALSNMLATIAQDSVDEGPCQYALMRKPLEKVNYAFAFGKGTNYANLFDKWIRRMSYSGLISHWTDEELDRSHRPKRCQQELEVAPNEVRKVGITDVIGVYICLAAGCAIGIVVFILELLTMCSGSRFGGRLQTFFDKRDAQSRHVRDPVAVTLNNGAVLRPQ
ncbi:putative glutamate receptor [Hypsibius exemplaris]|uniref:Glutamate receptor n=1 Tax=Hypsibius exemplaris TaxID=2072580 RepID=A0A1W0XAN8_HYPEX|nr:putative glutamate receptor [Hypsibius exemplaris]